MDHYVIWFDLRAGESDLELVDALQGWLGWLTDEQRIQGWNLTRRKLGFGPRELGEFMLDIHVRDLAQLDDAFDVAATRDEPAEPRHAAVYRRVSNVCFALTRDFPDPQRVRA